jgi:endo-1,4-beta-xylanase
MKVLYKVSLGMMLTAGMVSCKKDSSLDFQVNKPESIALQEQIDAVDALKTYLNREANPGFKLGGAADMASYMQKGVMYRLLNNNFDEITLGYEMKHGAIVDANGNMNFTNLNALLEATKAAGVSVYGHTLAWHANQNATYLKGLLAPLIVKAPAFANSLPLNGLKDGSFSGGWSMVKSGAGISSVADQGMVANTRAVKLMASATSANATDLQLVSPGIPVVAGHKYEVVCYIKSNVAGEGRLSFEGLANNTPKADWTKSGSTTETFKTDISWKEVRVQVDGFTGNTFKVNFDLGYKPNVTYYIDVNNLYVYDMQGTPTVSNVVANGDFEAGNTNGWGGWGNGSTIGVSAAGQGSGNKGYALMLNNPSLISPYYTVQTVYALPKALTNGETYNLSFWVKGDAEGTIRPELQSSDYSSNGFGTVAVTKEWKQVKLSVAVTTATRDRLLISYAETAGKVYLDDIVLSSASSSGAASLSVEKGPEERKAIIGTALNTWITAMVNNSKKNVKVWDVLNEPMDDGKPYELKTGVGRTLAADEFYWQDYLGKDYGVAAFKIARQNGNPGDIHFVNDYNLEYSLDKCRGLIEYVKYMESQGAKVDGIGTQMHISLDANKSNIDEMFKLLAATGKWVKISELDIGLKTTQATPELLQKQAELYKYVVDSYFKNVPKAQRYGITVWGILDSQDNASWRPGEKIGLWDLRYMRKPAYKSFAEGLAQK